METITMRTPCGCGHSSGRVDEKNGQACVFCAACGRWQYNAPKKERGLAPASLRINDISPSVRYRVAERAHFRCEFCGSTADERTMHVGHLISVEKMRELGAEHLARDFENLAWLCDVCNLGMGKHPLSVHDALLFVWRHRGDAA